MAINPHLGRYLTDLIKRWRVKAAVAEIVLLIRVTVRFRSRNVIHVILHRFRRRALGGVGGRLGRDLDAVKL
jgi:hypothetical protein